MNDDLETAVRYALEPLTQHGVWTLCPHCGATVKAPNEHTCRVNPLEFVGGEPEAKRRAKSYAIE